MLVLFVHMEPLGQPLSIRREVNIWTADAASFGIARSKSLQQRIDAKVLLDSKCFLFGDSVTFLRQPFVAPEW